MVWCLLFQLRVHYEFITSSTFTARLTHRHPFNNFSHLSHKTSTNHTQIMFYYWFIGNTHYILEVYGHVWKYEPVPSEYLYFPVQMRLTLYRKQSLLYCCLHSVVCFVTFPTSAELHSLRQYKNAFSFKCKLAQLLCKKKKNPSVCGCVSLDCGAGKMMMEFGSGDNIIKTLKESGGWWLPWRVGVLSGRRDLNNMDGVGAWVWICVNDIVGIKK